MCGRYVTPEIAEAERNLMVHWLEYERSYNVAPTHRVPVVRWLERARQGLHMRWGLVPFFAKGVPPKYSTINATIEKLESGPCWRGPWKRAQRCALVASGFFEWHVLEDGTKRPYYITCVDQPVFTLAGLWDRSVAADGSEIVSCTIITMPPNALMAEIHNVKQRMPAILAAEDLDAWLAGSAEEAQRALKQYPADAMLAYPVSTRVNSPKNNEAQLIAAV
jgi:putative SOS response-associated peptidase YedK